MSLNNNRREPYCKVCHDAGKPESEYKSHWVKDLKGNTLCPTLLNTECRYCYKLGHTAKFCNILVKNNKEKERAERRFEAKSQEKKPEAKKQANGFAALQEDSDLEEENKVRDVIYPSLDNSKADTSKKMEESMVSTCWAAIAAKPKVEEKQVIKIPTVKQDLSKPIYTRNWADWSDSEDDEISVCDKVNDGERDEGIYSDRDDDW